MKKERILKSINQTGLLLTYNDHAEFELHNEKGFLNITKILDESYNSEENILVYMNVMKVGSDRSIFEEDGGLTKKVDTDNILSYHICGNNLDHVLFYNTDEILDIEMKVKVREKR